MSITRSRELNAIYTQARDISRATECTLNSAHLLLALFTVPNQAAIFLQDRKITVDTLIAGIRSRGEESEEMMERIEIRCKRIAKGSGAEQINSLHLLAALIRESSSHAHQLLVSAGENVSAIRTAVMSYATGSRSLPKLKETTTGETVRVASAVAIKEEAAPSPIGIHPSLARAKVEQTVVVQEPTPDLGMVEPIKAEKPQKLNFEIRRKPKAELSPTDPPVERARRDEALDEARSTARKLAESLFKKRNEILKKQSQERKVANAPAPPVAESKPKARPELPDLGPRFPTDPPLSPARGSEESKVERVLEETTEAELADAYRLDPETYPNLTKFGRNLTEEAALGYIDRVIGRSKEVNQLIDIIGKRRSNNPILVGPAGVGKTAIVEGLANEFVNLAKKDAKLGKRAIIELEVGRIMGGTHLRGALSERLVGIKDEVRQAQGDVVVFLDEIHSWLSAGGGGDGTEAAGELKTALARGEFPCIGATTIDEFQKFVEADPAFERRFDVVFVDEPDAETTVEIVTGIRTHYEEHHNVEITDDALESAVKLAQRYIHERRLPDKAIGVLDLAGSRAARTGETTVDQTAVANIVAELAGIPAERLTQTDRERFLNMEGIIAEHVVGHQPVIETVCEVVRRNYAGFRSNRPIGSFLFLGPTGVGKTELVKALADFLFHDRDALVRFDMSEFMEAHAVSRLIGPPPGYIGYEKGGQLTEAVRRRPYQIVLLDEIEKAHPDVLNLLLQLFDEGRLTDGRGRTVDFANTCVVMTSNLGSDQFSERSSARIGFGGGETVSSDQTENVLSSAKSHFPLELWNRIDERLVFQPLTRAQVAKIAGLQLRATTAQLEEESGVTLRYSDAVIQHLVECGGFDPELGARPMRQTIQRVIEGNIARMLLTGETTRGDKIFVDVDEFDELRFTTND